jgi:D-proline reductase (dithiol) PrdB
VGLVQREIEAAGFSTITLANIPDLVAAVSAPRVAGIEFPFGQTVGDPGDVETQSAVLRATLAALQSIHTPGEVVQLPFEWAGNPKEIEHPEPPPIAKYLIRHPWHVRNLLKREIPEKFLVV